MVRVPPPNVPLSPAQLSKTNATATKAFVGVQKKSQTVKSGPVLGSLPISNTELKELAADLKNGVIHKEEANSRFIKTVINNSIRNSLGEKDREQLIHDIRTFFANDPDFVQDLAKNLNLLA
jgi:hypothetical protein